MDVLRRGYERPRMHRSHSLPDVTWTAGGPEATPPAAGKQTGGFEFKRFPRLLVALPVSSGRGECWNHTTRVTDSKRMHKDAKGEGGAEAWASGRDSASWAAAAGADTGQNEVYN